MNGIQVLMSQPWIARLGWTLLHFLWQGTAIAFLYTIVRFLFARYLSPRARYGFACTALMAMAAAPPLTFLTISNTAIDPTQMAAWAESVAAWKWLTPAVVAFWVAGMLGFSIRLMGAFRFTRRLRAASYAAPPIWQQALDQIAAQMGGPGVRLMGSSMVNVPGVIGCLRPIILVPVTFLTGTPAEQVIALLTHEMAHIRRNDYVVCILQSIAEVVLFYHPAVWWISGQIRAERELCCDDMAIACGTDALTYARALTEVARRAVRLNTQLAANGGSLADRIRRLIEPAYTGGHYLPGTGSALAMLLLWMVGAALAAVPGTQSPVAPTAASLAGTLMPPPPAKTSVPPSRVPESLMDQAQKTLLFDPVFSAQLAQAQPAGIGAGQTVAARPAAAPTGFVVGTVTARNASGGIIEGLTREDFAVTENDTRQEVSLFDFQNVDRLAAEASPLAQAAAGRPLSRLPRAEVAAESSAQLRYTGHRLVVLYFDMASMQASDQLRAFEGAQKFIATQMSSVDMLCLMRNVGAGVEVLQDFTSDRARLLSVVATLAASTTGGVNTGPADSGLTTPTTDSRLAALRSAAKMLGALKEKKVLVYISSGVNLVGTDNQAMLRAAIVDAVRTGVSIWPAGVAVKQAEALGSLAAETGSTAAAGSMDIAAGIGAAEKSIASYYIIGYTATDNAQDGTYRRVKVTLPGNTEAKLDYRQGYFAGKNFGPPAQDAEGKERQLQDAMVMGEPVTDLTVAAEVNYFRQNNAEYFAPITLQIPGSELAPAKKSGAQLASLEFAGEVKDSFGTNVALFRDVLEIRLANATAEELAARPVTYNTGVILLPGAYSIKVLVRDNATGRMGEYLSKLAVPNLNRETQLPLSSVVLSSQLIDEASSPAFAAGVKPRPAQALANPLVRDGKRMIPSVTRVFSSKSDMYVYLQALEKGATTTAPLTARVAFYKGPVKVMESSEVKVTDGLDPRSRMLPISMDVGLGSLAPGQYDCQVTVVDPATQKSAVWQKPVTIVP